MRMVKYLGLLAAAALPATALAVPQITGPSEPSNFPPSDEVVLHDQLDNPCENNTTSQNFEAGLDNFDSFLADDFVVPAGQLWFINRVEVNGTYWGGPGPAATVNVWIYPNAGGVPGALAEYTSLGTAFTDVGGDFIIAITPSTLHFGVHWLVIQANMNFTPNGQWGWNDRGVTTGNGAAWQNPGGGFGVCPTWSPRAAGCAIDPTCPDQNYRLSGDRGINTAVESSTWGLIKAIYQD